MKTPLCDESILGPRLYSELVGPNDKFIIQQSMRLFKLYDINLTSETLHISDSIAETINRVLRLPVKEQNKIIEIAFKRKKIELIKLSARRVKAWEVFYLTSESSKPTPVNKTNAMKSVRFML